MLINICINAIKLSIIYIYIYIYIYNKLIVKKYYLLLKPKMLLIANIAVSVTARNLYLDIK